MDAYNANPTSMQASIKSFLASGPNVQNYYLILGDMLELGNYSEREHQNILQLIQKIPNKKCFSRWKNIFKKSPKDSGYVHLRQCIPTL